IGSLNFAHNINFKYKNFKTLMGSLNHKPIRSLKLVGCGIVFGEFNANILNSLQWSNLQELFIGDNIIRVLESDAFSNVSSLKLLYVSNFMQFSPQFLEPLQASLEELIIDSTILHNIADTKYR
ncbi:unnamed protein product, partial [Owenia fusiformis]